MSRLSHCVALPQRILEQNGVPARFTINLRSTETGAAMLTLLGIYVLVGLLLAAVWSGASARRHVGGLKAFFLVVAVWPLIVFGMIVAGRNF